jgi:hypothetical protein
VRKQYGGGEEEWEEEEMVLAVKRAEEVAMAGENSTQKI